MRLIQTGLEQHKGLVMQPCLNLGIYWRINFRVGYRWDGLPIAGFHPHGSADHTHPSKTMSSIVILDSKSHSLADGSTGHRKILRDSGVVLCVYTFYSRPVLTQVQVRHSCLKHQMTFPEIGVPLNHHKSSMFMGFPIKPSSWEWDFPWKLRSCCEKNHPEISLQSLVEPWFN